MHDLSGKVALVTGAGGERGIGRAIAVRLAQQGADVVVNDIEAIPYPDPSSSWGGIPEVVQEIEAQGRQVEGILADVSDAAQVENMIRGALDRFGHIDILVNNAGSRPGPDRVPLVDLTEEAWDTVQRVNLKGTFLCSRAVTREMIRQGRGGKIIVISSVAGKRGVARYAAYCTSKFGLVGFTQALALELAPHRINVNAICPGLTDTERVACIASGLAAEGESVEEVRAQMLKQAAATVPLGRVAQATDIADVAAFLASPQSDYVTGLAVNVAGGSQMS
jgi:NAD(P)-dependent dehydrogenase (short-subunit alcohol dehydrogenase family)